MFFVHFRGRQIRVFLSKVCVNMCLWATKNGERPGMQWVGSSQTVSHLLIDPSNIDAWEKLSVLYFIITALVLHNNGVSEPG